jgi:uncharacterized protein YbjT (DUF2867 family)
MKTSSKIAVAGATGRVGRHIVDVLQERGHEAVPFSRSSGVDVISGDGVAEALAGADCVIDASTTGSTDQQEATDFFTTSARNLHASGRDVGLRRIVVVSIIGCERFRGGYGAAKHAHEQALLAGPIPVVILRAAQFHELVGQMLEWGRQGDVAYVQEMRTQLVAARSVAEALVDLAVSTEPPATEPIAEIAGPREESMVEAARLLVERRGDALRVEGVTNPADPDAELYVSGELLPGPHATLAGPTFEEWLEEVL